MDARGLPMTNDELADHFRTGFDMLHAKIDALPEGARRQWWEARLGLAHAMFNRLKGRAVEEGEIQPMSGGEDKPGG